MIYNKIFYLLGVFCILMSCTDDSLIKKNLVQSIGKEVQFGISAEDVKGTRTFYAGLNADKTGYILKWASDDRIVVASPMGESGNNNKVYDINVAKPGSGDAVAATTITPNNTYNPVGIQWGEPTTEKGSFYSIYPFRAETRRRPESFDKIDVFHNKIDLNDNGEVTATVLVEPDQRIWRNPYSDAEIAHNSAKEPTPTLLQMYGSNHSNVMWAQTDNVEYGTDVNLRFKPLSTCLMFTFTNPTTQSGVSSGTGVDAMIEEIVIDAGTGNYIAGPMKITFQSDGAPSDNEQGPNTNSQPKRLTALESYTDENGVIWEQSEKITIWPWIRSNEYESGIHPILRPGDTMQVCAFLLPTFTGNITSDWTVTVTINSEQYYCKLVPEGVTKSVTPGQIYEITMPPFDSLTKWNPNPAHWMEDIPNNTYITQLTFPGSWYSYDAEAKKEGYQTLTIEEQLRSGIRAFDISTRTNSTHSGGLTTITGRYTPSGIGISGTGSNTTIDYPPTYDTNDSGRAFHDGTDISEPISAIVRYIASTKKDPTDPSSGETGVIVLSYEPGGNGGHRACDYSYWLYGLANVFYGLDEDVKNNIYGFTDGNTINANTTLQDVRGRTIIKINIDDKVVANAEYYPYPTDNKLIPGLISYCPLAWLSDARDANNKTLDELDNIALVSQLYWQTWEQKYNSIILGSVPGSKERDPIFAWNFSCTNRTRNFNGNDPDPDKYTESLEKQDEDELASSKIPSFNMRWNALNSLKTTANQAYQNNYTNEWFLFGCGGTQTTSSTDNTTSTTNFAQTMNPWLLGQIQNIYNTNTPTPLGIVFLNQVGNPNPDAEQEEGKTAPPQNSTYNGDEIVRLLMMMNDAFYLAQKPTTTTTKAKVKSVSPNHSSGVTVNSSSWTAF